MGRQVRPTARALPSSGISVGETAVAAGIYRPIVNLDTDQYWSGCDEFAYGGPHGVAADGDGRRLGVVDGLDDAEHNA